MATSATTDLRFRLLGPLEVLRAGSRSTSAASASAACSRCSCCTRTSSSPLNTSSSSSSAPDASDSSVRAVRVAVSRLRRLLDDETLVTRPGGYVVYADPSQLDVAEFEALVMEGRSALDEGDPTSAAAAFRSALALFRGPPLADLALLDFVQPEIRRLEELRLSALMDRIDADLALGRGAELVPGARGARPGEPVPGAATRTADARALPLGPPERRARRLPPDARAPRRRARASSRAVALQQLERSMLQHDPALDLPERARAAVEPTVCPFKGLAAFEAADAFYFCGRERLLSEFDRAPRLRDVRRDRRPVRRRQVVAAPRGCTTRRSPPGRYPAARAGASCSCDRARGSTRRSPPANAS